MQSASPSRDLDPRWLDQLRQRFAEIAARRVPDSAVEDVVHDALAVVLAKGIAEADRRGQPDPPAGASPCCATSSATGTRSGARTFRSTRTWNPRRPIRSPALATVRAHAARCAERWSTSATRRRGMRALAVGARPRVEAARSGRRGVRRRGLFYRRVYRCRRWLEILRREGGERMKPPLRRPAALVPSAATTRTYERAWSSTIPRLAEEAYATLGLAGRTEGGGGARRDRSGCPSRSDGPRTGRSGRGAGLRRVGLPRAPERAGRRPRLRVGRGVRPCPPRALGLGTPDFPARLHLAPGAGCRRRLPLGALRRPGARAVSGRGGHLAGARVPQTPDDSVGAWRWLVVEVRADGSEGVTSPALEFEVEPTGRMRAAGLAALLVWRRRSRPRPLPHAQSFARDPCST